MNDGELDAQIDAVLKEAPAWQPPHGFARRVVVMAQRSRAPRSRGVFDVALPGLLVALGGCVVGLISDVLVDNATLVLWLCAGLAVWSATTFARRARV